LIPNSKILKKKKENPNLMIGFNVKKIRKSNNLIHQLILKIRIKRSGKLW